MIKLRIGETVSQSLSQSLHHAGQPSIKTLALKWLTCAPGIIYPFMHLCLSPIPEQGRAASLCFVPCA